jgi:hypothetical protein
MALSFLFSCSNQPPAIALPRNPVDSLDRFHARWCPLPAGLSFAAVDSLIVPAVEKTWTLYYWLGNGKSRVMGQLTCTEEAVQRAIAELPEDHRDNVYARPFSRHD